MNKRFIYLGVVAVVLLAVLGYVVMSKNSWNLFSNKSLNQAPQVIRAGTGAFGKLALGTQSTSGASQDTSAVSAPLSPAPSAMPSFAVGEKTTGMVARPYYGGNYSYKYVGLPLIQPDSQLNVLKRSKDTVDASQATSYLSGLNFNLANLSSFSNAKLQNFSLVQDQDYGYQFYVDLHEGTMSINQNWLKWPNAYTACSNAADQSVCYQQSQLKVNDMPADTEVITIANQFLIDHGVATSNYGVPTIENNWRVMYDTASAAEKASFYVPETVSVVFPMQFESKGIYEQGGGVSGLRVDVNVREKKVASLYGLQANVYQSSLYDATMDTDMIISLAEKGGYANYGYPMPLGAKTITPMAAGVTSSVSVNSVSEVEGKPTPIRAPIPEDTTSTVLELDTPLVAYLHMWSYNNVLGGASDGEYLVPSMIFPVKNLPKDAYYSPKFIIVPLIKDVLDTVNGSQKLDGAVPPSAGSGSSGTMTAPAVMPSVAPVQGKKK